MNIEVDNGWRARINSAVRAKDNNYIKRVKNAGEVNRGKQIMHNGIRINLGSYYGLEIARLLYENKGVHEPQEERVFMEVLKGIKPGSTMIELGSFWAFYSMWFYKEIKNAKCYMIEPDAYNIKSGRANFKLNGMKGEFFQFFVGNETVSVPGGTGFICIDDFIKVNDINFIDVLHCDIQGFEYDMLNGAKQVFAENKIGYIFVSTHSQELHYKCLQFLKEKEFIIICSADKAQSFSEDGLIVGRAPMYSGINPVVIDLNGE
ncbi:MAG: FkbM family methyltransferase [Bacteroidetes bacterium]|nr:FkbM family methyltransferase [Bacteroidota bacterium]